MSFIAGSGLQPIYSNVLSGAATNVFIQNIPQNFNHLVIIAIGRTTDGIGPANLGIQFNSDSGSNYDSIGSDSIYTTSTHGILPPFAGSLATSGVAGQITAFISAYTLTGFKKSYSCSGGTASQSSLLSKSSIVQGTWRSTAAINSIILLSDSGGNFVTNSAFYLYGMN